MFHWNIFKSWHFLFCLRLRNLFCQPYFENVVIFFLFSLSFKENIPELLESDHGVPVDVRLHNHLLEVVIGEAYPEPSQYKFDLRRWNVSVTILNFNFKFIYFQTLKYDSIFLVKDPEDLLQVVLGLLFILPLHHQVDKFKEVHSAWAVLVSLLKLSWHNSDFRNLAFTSISSSSSSSVGEHPIDRITAPNSFVDTVPSPSCLDDSMKTTTCWRSSPCRTSWTSAWNSPAARRWWSPWYSFHQAY